MASKILKGIFVFLSLGVFGFQGFSQEDKKQQTTPDSSLIEEVKTTSADNIPIVSLDENEG